MRSVRFPSSPLPLALLFTPHSAVVSIRLPGQIQLAQPTPGDSCVNPAASAATGDVTAPPNSGTPSSVLKLSFNRSSSGKGGGGGGGSGAGWNPQRAKIQLKLAIQRLRLMAGRKTQLAKTTRREIASLLEKGKIESAGIKVEGVMGDDLTIELLEMLELYCELLLARFGLLEQVKEIDPGVSEAVIGIIHAAPRTELKELHVLRDMLMAKGGRDFAIACMDNTDNCVPERITSKLIVATPPPELVDLYLYEIAKAYCIDWRPQGFPDPNQPVEAATPALEQNAPVPTAPAIPSTPTKAPLSLPPFDNAAGFPQTPPVDPSAAKDTVIVRTSLPSPGIVPPAAPRIGAPALRATPAAPKNTEEDAFEVLTKRFAELKKR
ncbi:BZ3500_MvSof-1268-A1-R1_Chr6-2g08532 [Microbotryum saponariae]|uniref:BZ3500_MvSof-1268-A1-R1_Chr6-2g08532 protein n=1 Tax=Microbotryum saponariae TaxID=289078 RepID=A0A2X0LPD6_9BASI|nr:BZ3500_MvSof-1268-A1-R1_Chr6-2g08532 [Microbotryum saponariae]SDA07809.1 BZ3501_MvSof-1269-A2-R1_Chr6-1g08246 [Microbotryum saponariae]